jgi:outer membrane protein assembly factor BamB
MRRSAGGFCVIALVLVLAGCGWLQPGYNAGHTNSSDLERTIGLGNFNSLVSRAAPGVGGPVIVTSDLFLTLDDTGATAFSRAACPTAGQGACTPLWHRAGVLKAVSDGTSIFVVDNAQITALDLQGVEQWHYPVSLAHLPDTSMDAYRLNVGGGRVFYSTLHTGHGQYLENLNVFSATDCGSAQCAPVRTLEPAAAFATVWAVDGNVIFMPIGQFGAGQIAAIDLNTGAELWRTAGQQNFDPGSMVARDGHLYVFGSDPYGIQDYPQSGAGCSGTPKVCAPTRVLGSFPITAIVAASGGHVVAMNNDRNIAYWFGPGTAGCTGTPLRCAPTARTNTYSAAGVESSVSLANGVLYVGTGKTLLAYDESATQNCGGSPKVCTPTGTKTFADDVGQAIVVDGQIYLGTGGGLRVLRLPS